MARGRPREFDREKALTAAMLLFWRKGYHATSQRDLAEALGIAMPSLYAAFGSKESLYVEAVDLYMQVSRDLLWRHLEESGTARDAIRELLLSTARELTDCHAHPVGCMVTLANVDEDMPPAVATAIRKARCDWLDVVLERLKSAVDDGELPSSTDVNSLSRLYVAIIQGIAVQAHDGADLVELKTVVDLAMTAWPVNAANSPSRPAASV